MVGFVEMARDDVVETMEQWRELKERRNTPRGGWAGGNVLPGLAPLDPELVVIIDKLVGSMTILLRAIEEVEARPWWKPRRYNPYAR